RGRPRLRGQPLDDQALRPAAPGHRRPGPQARRPPPADGDWPGPARGPAGATRGRPGRHAGRARGDLGAGAGGAGQPLDDAAGDPPPGLDAQKKTLAAAERDGAARAAWKAAVAALDPAALVFVDET